MRLVRKFKSRRLRVAGHVTRMEEGSTAFKILTEKRTEKRPLGTPRRRDVRTVLESILNIKVSI